MTIDLKSMTRKELEKLKSNVEKALEKVTVKEMKAARDAAEKAAAAHGFSLKDFVGGEAPKKRGPKPKKGPRTTAPAKYKNPADASQTWTGKGRQPNWFKDAVTGGTDPKALEI